MCDARLYAPPERDDPAKYRQAPPSPMPDLLGAGKARQAAVEVKKRQQVTDKAGRD